MHKVDIYCKNKYSLCDFASPLGRAFYAGMNLSRIRKSRHMNQAALADLIGSTQATISRAENMDDSVTLKIFKDCATALDVPLSQIFADDLSAEELRLVRAYRDASPERRRGWQEALSLATNPAR